MKLISRIRILSAMLVLLSASASAYLVFLQSSSLVVSLQQEAMIDRGAMEVERLDVAFREINHDITFVAQLPRVGEIADAFRHQSDLALIEEHESELAEIFTQILRAKPYYTQIRLIGVAADGRERSARALTVRPRSLN